NHCDTVRGFSRGRLRAFLGCRLNCLRRSVSMRWWTCVCDPRWGRRVGVVQILGFCARQLRWGPLELSLWRHEELFPLESLQVLSLGFSISVCRHGSGLALDSAAFQAAFRALAGSGHTLNGYLEGASGGDSGCFIGFAKV